MQAVRSPLKKDYSSLRQLMMRALSCRYPVNVTLHRVDKLHTFSLESQGSREYWPWLLTTETEILEHMEGFLADYNLRLVVTKNEQETIQFKISH